LLLAQAELEQKLALLQFLREVLGKGHADNVRREAVQGVAHGTGLLAGDDGVLGEGGREGKSDQ
jgi:hypothetical protein